jgi:hypothetical protein
VSDDSFPGRRLLRSKSKERKGSRSVNFAKVLRRRVREQANGADVAGDVNAVVASNVGRDSSVTHVSSQQHVQTGSKTPPRTKED